MFFLEYIFKWFIFYFYVSVFLAMTHLSGSFKCLVSNESTGCTYPVSFSNQHLVWGWNSFLCKRMYLDILIVSEIIILHVGILLNVNRMVLNSGLVRKSPMTLVILNSIYLAFPSVTPNVFNQGISAFWRNNVRLVIVDYGSHLACIDCLLVGAFFICSNIFLLWDSLGSIKKITRIFFYFLYHVGLLAFSNLSVI